jgi:hypothetical protein
MIDVIQSDCCIGRLSRAWSPPNMRR